MTESGILLRLKLLNLSPNVTIFTKGDDSAIKSGSFDGTDEQKRRIQLSGIDRVVSDLEKVHQLNSHIFAHPNKMKHFVEQVVMPAKEQARRIVYIEDTETNLDQAVEMIQGYGVEIVPILVCSDTSGSKKYTTIKDISHLPSVIKTYSNSDFVFDMDGVLLHEEFRKEHQPKNIYFALRAKGFLQ